MQHYEIAVFGLQFDITMQIIWTLFPRRAVDEFIRAKEISPKSKILIQEIGFDCRIKIADQCRMTHGSDVTG